MNANLLKFLAGVIGLAVWAWLAFMKMTPLEPLIDLLKMGLGGLVVHMLQDGGVPAQSIAPAPGGQAGFVSVRLLAVVAMVAIGVTMLSGCAALSDAGHSAYSFEANALGCKATADDGKEFKARTIIVDCAKGQMAVDEGEAKAFKGQAISAKAASVLPVTDLANILSGAGK